MMKSITAHLVDIPNKRIFPAKLSLDHGKIIKIEEVSTAPPYYIMPGFIDAHIHIESSMLTPYEFSKKALIHGTIATVSDPHEIANVCGIEGVNYMIDNAKHSPLKFFFGAPSCVPATPFETAGAIITSNDIDQLLARDEIKYLAEMMNFPGVLMKDKEVMAKIDFAKKHNKPIDGHAPGLKGELAQQYAVAGITTDHECVTIEEALDKIKAGMKILIREGSAAKNYEALIPLMATHPDKLMFCSDDKHPDDLLKGHINELVKRTISKGYNLYDVLYAACISPIIHYNLPLGHLQIGDDADFIIVNDLINFDVITTYINGNKVVENSEVIIEEYNPCYINNFNIEEKQPQDFVVPSHQKIEQSINVIEALDGQLITNAIKVKLKVIDGKVQCDTSQDLLYIGVVNRYNNTPPFIGFVKNFGLQKGAIASSVAHDSHNIVFVGCNETSICKSVNAIIQNKGGISVDDEFETSILPLPIAGLMSDKDVETVGKQYEELTLKAKALGSKLSAPFMTLSFMALPVIPSLKITDKGLFDVDKFAFSSNFA